MRSAYDLIIIGHGLAGSVLADKAMVRGLDVLVIDRAREGRATPAAAGLVNPIVLRRLVPSWRANTLLPLAEAYYSGIANGGFWHPVPLVKLHSNKASQEQWQRAERDPDVSHWLSHDPAADVEASPIQVEHGHGTVHRCAWLDVNGWLEHHRQQLQQQHRWREAQVEMADISSNAHGAKVLGEQARWVVQCEGPFAQPLPGLVPVAGDVLTVRMPGLELRSVVHGGVFLLPLPDGLFRVGSTFAWDDPFAGPRTSAREHLLTQLRAMLPVPVDVVEHRWGVRPTSRDRRPLIGPLREGERIATMNGLGARGVLQAPWCADHLLDHLFAGEPLDPVVNVLRGM